MITNPTTPTINSREPTEYFESLINWGILVLVIAASVYFFYNFIKGGIEWMGSGGDKNKLTEARLRVLNSIIGLVVVFGMIIIINFLETLFGFTILGFSLADLAI